MKFVYKFDAVLEKGVNISKKEEDVLDLSVLDPINAINKAKIKFVHKNNMAMADITMVFTMNTARNQVNSCWSSD